ncbi:MAG: DNA polymerase III subunit gamma/tau [Candidatus Woesebacteria bacterium]|nr:MAG: DNA polymerase III subunit gamma/tau [Candidatus Woesebacteria bacterium]
MTLYLKYRSNNLDELDLPEVRESLKKIVTSGQIPHAFLFAGPKGTGKTSAARILAKIINCEEVAKSEKLKVKSYEPCDKCEQCISITKGNNLDVVEMDAASHRGIDDVRTLKDAVKLSPVKANKKIYIIDEAHMLTTEASNALLKTLEEPPEHVVFILATTNPEKLIDTIRSRTTFIRFRKASSEEIRQSLTRVIKGENLDIDPKTLEDIAGAANGSFRDAVKLLEQVSVEGNKFLEKGKAQGVEEFVNFLYKKDLDSALNFVKNAVEAGAGVEALLKQTLTEIHKNIISDVDGSGELILLAELLIEANRQVPDSPIEELPLEIAVIKWCGEVIDNEELKIKKEDVNEPTPKTGMIQAVEIITNERISAPVENMEVEGETWKNVLSLVKPINASIEALLRAARPVAYDGKTLTLGVYYKFHKERLEDNQHRRIVEDVVGKVLQSPTRVVCTLVDPPVKKIVEENKIEPILTEGKDKDIIKVAEEIFGN